MGSSARPFGFGGSRPAFDVPFAADTKSGAVAGVPVDNVGSDMGRMAPTSDALAAVHGTRTGEHLADWRPSIRHPGLLRRPWALAHPARINTDGAEDIDKQRAATSERVDAQARDSGPTRFVVRGIDKARAVASWQALPNNMACAWRFATA